MGVLKKEQPIVVVEMSRQQQEIFELLRRSGYKHFIEQDGNEMIPGQWPENLIASMERVRIPERGSF